jgi:hypothetical protein
VHRLGDEEGKKENKQIKMTEWSGAGDLFVNLT